MELHRQGRPTPRDFMANRPDLFSCSVDLYEAFLLCTPDLNGNLTVSEMRSVLEVFGITERSEQIYAMNVLRQMHREHRQEVTPPDG